MTNDHTPPSKTWREKIGDRELVMPELPLDVFDQVTLWNGNPRLMPFVKAQDVQSEIELQALLQQTTGYDVLLRSIRDLGQMEPVYAWRKEGADKYLILEGATRVSILRELATQEQGSGDAGKFRYVDAKILPPDFSIADRTVLLAKIHVRGTGVRSWGRYVEAKFIHDSVTPVNGSAPIMSVTQLANHMGKSISWVTRLKDAYTFALEFVDYLDSDDAEKLAASYFSTLEEISKSTGFGPVVRDYETEDGRVLREEVFEMVRNDVFKEYRDARFMKQFHDDPEKWAQLKTHQQHIANTLAAEEKRGAGNLATRISALPTQIARALARNDDAVSEEAIASLEDALLVLEDHFSSAGKFRTQLRRFTSALYDVPLSDVKAVTQDEFDRLKVGLDDFQSRFQRVTSGPQAS